MITKNGHRWYQSELKNYTSEFLQDIIDDLLEKQRESHISNIRSWMIMLDSPDFDDNDAGMVRDEMRTLLNKYDVISEESVQ